MLQCLATIPEFMRRGKMLFTEQDVENLRSDIQIQYDKMKWILDMLSTALLEIEQPPPLHVDIEHRPTVVYVLTQRAYGLSLYISVIFNRILFSLGSQDNDLVSESSHFSKEILSIAEQSHIYRPLGSAYIILCLAAGLAAATDELTRTLILGQVVQYKRDFQWSDKMISLDDLESMDECRHFIKMEMFV